MIMMKLICLRFTEPADSYLDDLNYLKDFENEFPAIVYNDALTSKSDFLIKPNVCPQHVIEFTLKDETSFSKYNEEEQNVLYFNDLFYFNVIYLDDSKSNKDNDDKPWGNASIIPLPDKINTDVDAYAQGEKMVSKNGCDVSDMALPPRDQRLGISSARDFLGTTPSYTLIKDLMLRLCHWLIACNIVGRSQAPKKIYKDLDDTWAWVSLEPKRQQVVAASAPEPPPAAGPARTMSQRLCRLEEDVHGLRGALGEQRENQAWK
uniref:Uncharacterized protein n=1 Tax=Tanacetum cinerariifolium TaxID=118510 RepID=A0A6L2MEH1_TANCI|nr:hypothetical protein [Tanacetum cinerariifolium]